MSREIKFRVFDKASRSFLFSEISGKHPFHFIGGLETYEILPSHPDYVLQQYTGIKDKNGKEVFEGDVVRIHFQATFFNFGGEEVMGMPGHFTKTCHEDVVVKWEGTGFSKFTSLWKIGVYGEQTFEVVGNIHEN